MTLTLLMLCLVYTEGFGTLQVPISQLPKSGNVCIKGKVTKVLSEKELLITDNSGTIQVTLPEGSSLIPLGEKVTLKGHLDKKRPLLSYPKLKATSVRRANGEVSSK